MSLKWLYQILTALCLRTALSYSHVACGRKCIQILVHFKCREWQIEEIDMPVFSFFNFMQDVHKNLLSRLALHISSITLLS